jgi:NADPH-dependent curcumin reductase CurA
MTGLTAYFGLLDVGKVQAGDVVVVSGAAGATGSVVCQIAKLKGAKVIAIAGSADKVAWLKEMGMDEALNYKAEGFAKQFREVTKGFIDIFFDNGASAPRSSLFRLVRGRDIRRLDESRKRRTAGRKGIG